MVLMAKLWSNYYKNGFLVIVVYKLVYEFTVKFVTKLVLLTCSQEEDSSNENENNKEYLKVMSSQTYKIIDYKTHHERVAK